MWYNVDVKKLATQNIPTILRADVLVAYVKALVKPIDDIYYLWFQNRNANIYILAHNGQKCYLRAVLNDNFDREARRIEIDDGTVYEPVYIYTDAEITANPYLSRFLDLTIYQDSELSVTAVDFFVRVPEDVSYNEYEMKYLIDFYKLGSKRYKRLTL